MTVSNAELRRYAAAAMDSLSLAEQTILGSSDVDLIIKSLTESIEKLRRDFFHNVDVAKEKGQALDYFFEWSDKYFAAAAKEWQCNRMIQLLTYKRDHDDWHRITRDEYKELISHEDWLQGGLRAVPRSTSATSNLMEQHKLQAVIESQASFGAYELRDAYIDGQWADEKWVEVNNKYYAKRKEIEEKNNPQPKKKKAAKKARK